MQCNAMQCNAMHNYAYMHPNELVTEIWTFVNDRKGFGDILAH